MNYDNFRETPSLDAIIDSSMEKRTMSDEFGDGLDSLTPLEGCEKLIRDYNKKRNINKQEFLKYLNDYIGQFDEKTALKMYDDENRWSDLKISGEKFMKILNRLRYQLILEEFALSLGSKDMTRKQFGALLKKLDAPLVKRDFNICWRYIDKDGNGNISLDDLRRFVRNIATKNNVESIRKTWLKQLKQNKMDKFFASDRFMEIVKAVSQQAPSNRNSTNNNEAPQPKKVKYYENDSNHKYQDFLSAIHNLASTKFFNMADFEELSRALGLKVSDRESRILFRYLDKERDNSVEFEEFRSFLKHQATEKKLEKIRKKIFKNLGKSKTKLLKETVIVYRELSESDDPPLDPVSDIVIEDGDYYDARNYNLTLLVEKLKAKDVKKTLKQLRHYKRLFNIMDENENTVIDINEFGRVMTDLIGVSPLSVSRDIFRLVDNNLDGTIKSEGIHIIADALREHFDPVINKRTKLARERGKSFQETLNEWHEDGGADPRKFRMMMRGLGLHMLGESDMSTLFEELDMDTNQSVSLSQFQEFLQTTYGKELERIKEAVLIQLGDKAEVLIDFNSVFNPMGSHRALLGTADVLEELETVSPQLTMQRINTLRNWKHHFAFGDHDESDGAAIGLEDYLLFMKQTVGIRDREILKTVFELKDERDGDSEGLLTIPQINDLIQDIIVRYQTDLKNNTKRDLIDKVNSAIAEYLVNDECTEKMFKKFLKALGAKVSDRDVRIVFRYLDKDKDLTITHYEVYGFFKHANHSSQNDKIRKKIIDHWNAKDEEILEIFFAREPAHKPMLKSRQSELPNLIKGKISKTWKEHKKSEIQAKQKKKKRKSSSKKKKERDRNRIQKPIPVGGRGLLSARDVPKKESTKPPKPKSILKKPSYDRVSERSIASEKSISFEALTSFIVDDKEKIESTRQELLDIDEDPMGETRKEMEEKLKKLEEEVMASTLRQILKLTDLIQ